MTSNAGSEESGVERAEEQGGYGTPTPEEEMGPNAGQESAGREGEAAGREGESADREGQAGEGVEDAGMNGMNGMAGEPTD